MMPFLHLPLVLKQTDYGKFEIFKNVLHELQIYKGTDTYHKGTENMRSKVLMESFYGK